MRNRVGLACGALGLAAVFASLAWARQESTHIDPQDFSLIERGRYLTLVADCAACHTEPGGPPFAGGRPIETPFGVVAAPNITPDLETGIGGWSDEEFLRALREGKAPSGASLYPAMPYPYYAKLTREDGLAMRAYLNTVAPVRNAVVANRLPFPLDIRQGMTAWNALYFTPGGFAPDPSKSAEWNRGAYLVEGAGHCGACHTPKTQLGGDETSRAFQGYALQGWFAPNITNDMTSGLGSWSLDDIVSYLRTGHNATSAATGTMGEEVEMSTSHFNDADLRAVAVYLKDLAGSEPSGPPLAASDPRMAAGAAIYKDACAACHADDGKGVAMLFPALAGSPNVRSADPATLIRVLLEGAESVATDAEPTGPIMPSFSWRLDDAQAAAVLTYIRNAWGSAAAPVDEAAVKSARKSLAARRAD